ncbi:NAD-binding protein [Halorubellus sp. PRR65]|uniref:NAD-binding protein n=1 Tax=Halorubellus sp. PRR65 TaxID=3098148 RepID=UPI002B25A966|nr:NAD-binding protein [Halorubellus sp. PRR65]
MSLKPPTNPFSSTETSDEAADYYVLGGNHVGEAVAERLLANGHDVTVVTESSTETDLTGSATEADLTGVDGDASDLSTLEAAGVADASTVVVATRTDARNLLVAQLVRTQFDVPRVVVLTNHPDRMASIDDAGHDPVCATNAIADAIVGDL